MSYLDKDFRYLSAASHNDVRAFHRRQQARKRVADEKAGVTKAAAEQAEREAQTKVLPLRKAGTA